jgi:hypothetical protein
MNTYYRPKSFHTHYLIRPKSFHTHYLILPPWIHGGRPYSECLGPGRDAAFASWPHAYFPAGKRRHCGQRIKGFLHFLLVEFLADKTGKHISIRNDDSNAPGPGMTAHLSSLQLSFIIGTTHSNQNVGVVVTVSFCVR